MKYGMDRVGFHEHEKCPNCEWEGFRSELEKDYVFDENAEEGDTPIDEHWVCPNCKAIIIE